jgi:iron complex outermembrane receptor protein
VHCACKSEDLSMTGMCRFQSSLREQGRDELFPDFSATGTAFTSQVLTSTKAPQKEHNHMHGILVSVLTAVYFIGGALYAQADILKGIVLDPQGGVVPNAELVLFDRTSASTYRTTGSADGNYSFPNIPTGSYLMEVQAAGAALVASEFVTVNGATDRNVTLSVARSAVRVFVTATTTPISDQEVARVVDVVDAAQIDERAEYAVAEVLRTVPGVQIQTQQGGVFQIRTRGLSNQYTAILFDGLRFRDANSPTGDASGFLSDLIIADKGRVEFLRGSGSSLYGTNAIGGAVSLESNTGGGAQHGAVRIEGGGLGFFRGALNAAGGIASDRFVYSGGVSHVNVSGGVRGSTPHRNTSGEFYGKYDFGGGMSVSGRLWGSPWVYQRAVDSPAFNAATLANFTPAPAAVKAIPLADSELRLYETRQPFVVGNATFIPGVPDPDANRRSSFDATAVIFQHRITPNTSWRAAYQLVNTRRALEDGPAGLGFESTFNTVSNFDGRTHQLQLRFDNDSSTYHHLTGGYEFEREFVDSLASRNQIGGVLVRITAAENSHSVYGQDQIRLLDGRFQIVVGGRIQKFELKQPTFTGATSPYERTPVSSPESAYTGDLSVAYFLARTSTKIRTHLGSGYKAPSLFERFGSGFFGGSFSYFGDPGLGSEGATSFDAGIDQWLFNNRIRASATFFYTDLNETITFGTVSAQDPFGRFSGYRNSPGGGISRGIELSAQLSPASATSITMSYTHNNSEMRSPTIGTNFYEALRTARHIVSLTATQWVTRRFNVTVDFYGLGDTFESPFGSGGRVMQFPSPKRTDAVANYSLPVADRDVDIYFKVENLLNRRYTDNGFLAPEAWALAGLKFEF